jgi:hypothetical protein
MTTTEGNGYLSPGERQAENSGGLNLLIYFQLPNRIKQKKYHFRDFEILKINNAKTESINPRW